MDLRREGKNSRRHFSEVEKRKPAPRSAIKNKKKSIQLELPSDTRERLIQVAKNLFAEKGFDGTTVKDLSEAAEVNISLISYHFNGKEGLYRTCLEQFGRARLTIAERVLQPPQSPEEFKVRLTVFIEEVFTNYIEEPQLSQVVMRECEMQNLVAEDIFRGTFLKVYETLLKFFTQAQLNGILRKDIDPEITSRLMFGGILQVIQKDHLNERYFGKTIRNESYRKEMVQNAITLWLHGSVNSTSNLRDQS